MRIALRTLAFIIQLPLWPIAIIGLAMAGGADYDDDDLDPLWYPIYGVFMLVALPLLLIAAGVYATWEGVTRRW